MKTRLRFALGCSIVLVLLLAGPSSTSGSPSAPTAFSSQEAGLGQEYQLSSPTNPETDRYAPAAVYNTTLHQTLVVWHRHGGGSFYVEGRLINAGGKPMGSSPTILVSGSTPVYQPAVAYNATNNQYLLVWMRNTLLDGKTYAVWAKILNANLTEARPEYQILQVSGYSLWSPRVAWNSKANEYMIAWNSFDISGWPSMTPTSIAEATLYGNGDIVPNPITVIYNTPENLIYPNQVDLVFFDSGDPYGKYLWVWKQVKPGTADFDIWGANIDAFLGGYVSGLPPFKIDDSPTDQSSPRIATTGADDFMVVWQQRSPNPPNDWDIRGREMNQIGTFLGDVHVIAGWGATDEMNPFVAASPGNTPRYVVGYERQSPTGQGIWLAYYENGANTLHLSNYIFWMDTFPAADYGFWTNSSPTGVLAGPNLQFAYQGVSNTPGDHPHIYSRAWSPYLAHLPLVQR